MRPLLLTCAAVAFGCAASAQFSVLPQLGFENSRTSIALNEQSLSSPLGGKVSPQAAIRLQYAFKKNHGPFIGAATSRSVIAYNFPKPEPGVAYTASRGGTQLRLEGGYQVSTKPIFFKNAPSAKSPATSQYQKSMERSGCGKAVARSGCGSKQKVAAVKQADKRLWMRIQPSVGMAYIPGTAQSDIYTKEQATYQYNAGNWRTALLSGVALQFGRAARPGYNISLNYVKGLSNMDTRTLTTMVDNKPTTTSLKSSAQAWNLRLGIPLSFAKKQLVVKQLTERTYDSQKGNTQYKSRCGQYKMQYKSRCTRVI
jgi:hypothetical protein